MSFDALLQDPGLIFTFYNFIDYNIVLLDGVALFEQFLISEFSEENLQFWRACNRYNSNSVNGCDLVTEARAIFKQFLVEGAPKQVREVNTIQQ